ncbi:hypothetical protein EJB05_49322, partial [Eragrostis curvula]
MNSWFLALEIQASDHDDGTATSKVHLLVAVDIEAQVERRQQPRSNPGQSMAAQATTAGLWRTGTRRTAAPQATTAKKSNGATDSRRRRGDGGATATRTRDGDGGGSGRATGEAADARRLTATRATAMDALADVPQPARFGGDETDPGE